VVNRSGQLVAWNRQLGAVAELAFEQLVAERLAEFGPMSADDLAVVYAGLAAVLSEAQTRFSCEFADVLRGDQRWVAQVTALSVEAGGGAVINVAPVDSAARSGRAASRHDDSFRTIFDASLDAMVIADAKGTLVESNPAARRMLGQHASTLQTMEFAQFFSDATRTLSPGEAWQRLIHDGTWRGEGRLQRTDSLRVLDIAASAHVMPGKHLITLRDVTESQQMEAQLRQAQKMEAIGLLTGGMAHDFNNLLTVVLANADLVLESLPLEMDELRDEVSQMAQAALRGTEMVKKLLAFSRRDTLERRPVSLEVVLAETRALLARLLPSTITVNVEAATDLPGINADPGAIQHMLLNLATNARDAMPSGGTLTLRGEYAPAVELVDGSVTPMVTLTVEDTGRGMDDDVLAHLFEPFFTTKAPGEGTGLGMAMIYGLVQQHAGTIDVRSAVGTGTTVTIGFPLAEPSVSALTPRSLPLVRTDGFAELILLVEDEEMVRRAGRRILEKHGYRVLQASDGAEALALLRSHGHEIALVVSDVVMPRMGGRELYASLRAEGFVMPFLFTSGYTDRMSSDSVPLDPNVPVLPKPWTWSELTASVRSALDEGFTPAS
jgi:two-component system, cell cycle sensor histidine kinase and response regulator CckA